jgi:predicted nucleotidyltransferase
VRRSWKLLSALRTALRTEHNVHFALLFGSTARGTHAPARPVDTMRWLLAPVRHLEDLPRRYAALEHAMATFGADFDLQQFKAELLPNVDRAVPRRSRAVTALAARLMGKPDPASAS